jgi:hypothetical protein
VQSDVRLILSSDSSSHPPERRSGRVRVTARAGVAVLGLFSALFAASCPSAFAELPTPTSTSAGAVETTTTATSGATDLSGPATGDSGAATDRTGPSGAATETTSAATGATDSPGAATDTTDVTGAATDSTRAATDTTGAPTDTTKPVTAATELVAAPTKPVPEPVVRTTAPVTKPMPEPVAGTTAPVAKPPLEPAAGTSEPVTDPAAGTTEPLAPTTTLVDAVAAPAAAVATPVDTVSPSMTAPIFAPWWSLELARPAAADSTRVTLGFLDAATLRTVDPALSELSLLLPSTALTPPARGRLATTSAAAPPSRPAPEAPESPARSQLSGGGASPFGGGFSLSLFALLLVALAGLAPRLSERLIATSARWRSVALVVLLERPG